MTGENTEELEAIFARAQQGDVAAYGQVVRRFQDMAVGYAGAVLGDFHLAEDAAQEAFVEAFRRAGQGLRRGGFRPVASAGSFSNSATAPCGAGAKRRGERKWRPHPQPAPIHCKWWRRGTPGRWRTARWRRCPKRNGRWLCSSTSTIIRSAKSALSWTCPCPRLRTGCARRGSD